MKRRFGYALLALALVLGLLPMGAVLTPARFLIDLLDRRLPHFGVQASEGTLSAGSAQGVHWRTVRFEHLNWDWQPLALLTGWLEFQVDTSNSAVKLVGNVAVGWNRQWRFQNLAGRLSIAQAGALAGKTQLPLQGNIEFHLGDLYLNAAGRPQSAHGVIDLRQLRVLADQPLDLGDFALQLTQVTPQGIRGTIQDGAGPLAVTGTFKLQPDGGYHVNAQIAVRDPGNRILGQAISRGLGPPNADGRWTSSFAGVLAL